MYYIIDLILKIQYYTHTHTHTHTHNIYCTKNNAAVAQLIIQIFTIVFINLFICLLFSGVNVGQIRTEKEQEKIVTILFFFPLSMCVTLSLSLSLSLSL